MQFLYPNFLWALLTLAIPIIVHLFYFRRFKKVYFTNVKFLKEVKEETSSRNKLKNLLVLLMRCLAIAALVFAFAQPFIPTGSAIKIGTKEVSLFVDNSFSMNAEKDNIPLIDYAKETAREIIKAYDETDKFQILTHDFEGRHQRLVSQEDALSFVDEIQASPSVKELSRVFNRQNQILKGEHKISYILSDFQQSIFDITDFTDTLVEVNLLPIQAPVEKNLAVDSAWFVSPIPMINQSNLLVVRVRNYNDEEAENVKISILKDGMERPIGVVNILPNNSITDTISLTLNKVGIHQAEVKISDYPVQFDDSYYLSFNVEENVKVLEIKQAVDNKYLTALFNGIDYFDFEKQDLSQIRYQEFPEYNVILLDELSSMSSGLNNELKQYVEDGGNVVVFPSAKSDVASYNTFLSLMGARQLSDFNNQELDVSNLNTDEFIFSNVFENTRANIKLPSTKGHYSFQSSSSRPQEVILRFRNGESFLSKYKVGTGQLFVCASPLDVEFSDLSKNAEIFVPLIYKIAISTNNKSQIAYTIGENNTIEVKNTLNAGDRIYRIRGQEEFIPSQINAGNKIILDFKDQITKSGFYDLNLGEEKVNELAFNFNNRESNLNVVKPDDLNLLSTRANLNVISSVDQSNISNVIGEKDTGIVLWKWFIIAALIFLLIEMLLIRLIT